MGNKWTKIKLKELGKIVTGKTPSSKINEPFSSQGVLFVTPRDMKGQRWIIQTERYLSDEGLKAVKNSFIPKGSIAVSCIGSDMGKANIIKADSVTNQQINSIIIDKSKHDPLFIYYSLSLKQEYFKSIASGSATPILNKNDFGECEIDVPSKESQIIISSFLDVLDTKIEINNKINQTLEQMSQTLFKSWFVDFDPVIDNALDAGNPIPEALQSRTELRQKVRNSADFKPLPADIRALFPAEIEETELGWVPKGWTDGNLGDVTKILSGFAFKSEDFGDEGQSVIKIKNITIDKTINIDDTQKISDNIAKDANRFQLFDGDILMAMTGATVGKFGILATKKSEEYYLNQRVAKFETDNKAYLYCVLNQESTDRFITNTAQGSAQPNISAKDILSIPLTIPSGELINTFNTFINHLFCRMIANIKANLNLTNLRDTLLPKLISGELSLEDLQERIAETEAA